MKKILYVAFLIFSHQCLATDFPHTIETERLRIVHAENEEHVQIVVQHDLEEGCHGYTQENKKEEEFKQLKNYLKRKHEISVSAPLSPFGDWIVYEKTSGNLIGTEGFSPPHHTVLFNAQLKTYEKRYVAECARLIKKSFQKNGYGTECHRALAEQVFTPLLGKNVYIYDKRDPSTECEENQTNFRLSEYPFEGILSNCDSITYNYASFSSSLKADFAPIRPGPCGTFALLYPAPEEHLKLTPSVVELLKKIAYAEGNLDANLTQEVKEAIKTIHDPACIIYFISHFLLSRDERYDVEKIMTMMTELKGKEFIDELQNPQYLEASPDTPITDVLKRLTSHHTGS